MSMDYTTAAEALRQIAVIGNEKNKPVILTGQPEQYGLICIGIGTDAAVFTHPSTPGYAYKMYSELALEKKKLESMVYERLQGIPYFPQCYGEGDRYLILSYEPGVTLHECLTEGIPVPDQVIHDVEEARTLVRSRGLNPRDIHLKNVLLQNGRGKVIDVSEYVQEGNDNRWSMLLWAHRNLYPYMLGKKVPEWLLHAIKQGYRLLSGAAGIMPRERKVK
ncbi:serine/threonine protein kinase [Paenibacillus sp. GCM10023252]|uniref:serine/threonine protein kinase n=1 Tax=Paenibacillus sp. GCM10023252 TaxID=3252649 RepID=UPI00360BDA32